jgi:hypothetical protein
MTSIEAILKRRGPSLSSELVEELRGQGLSEVNARQRISRAQDNVARLAGLRLANGVRFIYLPDQFGTPEYWAALERAFRRSGKAYWGAVAGLRARGGICPLSQFPVVCGAPMARKGQLSPTRILDRLKAIQLLEETAVEGASEPFVQFRPHCYDPRSAHEARAVLMAESVVLHGLRDWARGLGLGSFGKFRVRGGEELPVVSSVAWDLSAPSYVRPLASIRDGRVVPGFIVADVVLGGSIDADEVAVFVRKHDMASASLQAPSAMPFLVGEVFTQEGFALAKQKGILPVTTTNLFGVEIAKALKALIQLLADTGERAAVNPEYLEQVLNSLTRIEGAANNLRGALFDQISKSGSASS